MQRREFMKISALAGVAISGANLFAADTQNKGVQMINLNNGAKVPVLGFGTYQITGAQAQRSVEDALEVGYRLIDTARYYKNEREVGAAIKSSGIKRDEIFVTSKIYSSGFEASMREIDASVAQIGSWVDLMLIHWPVNDDEGTYKALENALAQGKIRAIGISNYYGEDLKRILGAAKVKPVLNQVECHIFRQQTALQRELGALGGIKTQAWSPFGGGSHTREILGNETVGRIAKKHGKTPAQTILRWLVQREILVIPKTTKKARMEENFSIFDFALDEEDMGAIKSLDKNQGLFGWYS